MLLREIRDVLRKQKDKKLVYIEGGRAIKIRDVLQLTTANYNQFDRYESALRHYEQKRVASLADRVFDALFYLDRKDAYLKAKHSDAVDRWIGAGKKGECPTRAQPPLDRLFELVSEIFPQIALTYDASARRFAVNKNGSQYGPSNLSDGEKQVFSILADLIELDDDHEIIIADEPELNLHPELAERLWSLVENEFPEKRFIYATHSIGFALRGNVEKVWVLSTDATNIAEFSGLETLPRSETTALLGCLPGILSTNRALVTEGHEKSFDAIFFRWLLSDNSIEILPCGSCTDVASIVGKQGIWNKISSRIKLVGVIDADYRDDAYLKELMSENVHALELHEAEAYLCVPQIICAVANRIGSQERPLTSDEVAETILSALSSQQLLIAARRVFARSHITLRVSLERKLLNAAANRDALVEQIKATAEVEVKKAHDKLSPEQLEQWFNEESATINGIIADRDVGRALRLLPAKELLNQLSPRAGCKNGTDLMRALRKNYQPTEFYETKRLSEAIGQVISSAQ